MIKLRDYQQAMIEEAREKLRRIKEALKRKGIERGPRLLLQCPTGGGKTVLASFITRGYLSRSGTVRFLCHRDFLVDQTSQTFSKVDIDHSFIAAGRWTNAWSPAHIGMVQTVGNRLSSLTAPGACIWDEAHHISAKTWAKIMEAWNASTHIGLSATPCRLDGKGLDAHFDDIVIGPSPARLIELGALSDYKMFAPTAPDLTGVHTRMGDYVTAEIDEVMSKAVVIGDLVQHYRRLAHGLKAVYFCTSVKNSIETAAAFNAAGYRWLHLDGTHSSWERKQAAMMMAKGELDGFCNVDLFGEGFDLAAQAGMDVTVECVGLARPTQSLGLYMQQVGRALRPKDRAAVILDHAGNLDRHGLPDDDREWSLSGVEKKKPGPMRECEGCGAKMPAAVAVCRHCGHVSDDVDLAGKKPGKGGGGRPVEYKDGELQEVDKDRVRKAKKLEEWQAGSIQELIDLGKARRYDHPEEWAARIWTMRKQREEAKEYAAKQQMEFFEKVMVERVMR